MSKPFRRTRLLAATLALGVALPGVSAVWAQSQRDKIVEITTKALEANGAKKVEYGKIEGDDARFTISDTKIVSEAEGKTSTVTVARTVWAGAVPTPDGGYKADEITAEGFAFDAEDAKIRADRVVLTNYVGQAPAKVVPGKVSGERLEKALVTGVVVTTEDGKTVPIASIGFSASDYVGDTPRKAAFDMKGLVVPLDPKDPDVAPIRALGYENLALDASFSGSWDDKTGRLEIADLTIGTPDTGALKIAAVVGGLTPQVVEEMKKAEGDQEKSLAALQKLSVESLSLRWNDASLAARVLAQQAKDQGVDAQTYAKQLKLMLPAVLSMVGNKGFEKKVATAAGTFLDAPKSLRIVAKPATPVPFAMLVGTALTAPQSLPDVLGVDVGAND